MYKLFQQRILSNFSVGTFNVGSLTSNINSRQLSDDLKRFSVQVCCLQETKIQDGGDGIVGEHRIAFLHAAGGMD